MASSPSVSWFRPFARCSSMTDLATGQLAWRANVVLLYKKMAQLILAGELLITRGCRKLRRCDISRQPLQAVRRQVERRHLRSHPARILCYAVHALRRWGAGLLVTHSAPH